MTERPAVVMMTESEARDRVEQINNHSTRIGELLLELHDRQGWKALGYATWGECTESAFKYSRSRLYQLLDAARVEKNVSNVLDIDESLPARAVDQLKHLDPEQRREVVQKAKEAAPDSKITAKQVEQAVQALDPDEVKPPVQSWDRKTRVASKHQNAISDLVQSPQEKFQTKVTMSKAKKGGEIAIRYYSNDDLQRILSLLGI